MDAGDLLRDLALRERQLEELGRVLSHDVRSSVSVIGIFAEVVLKQAESALGDAAPHLERIGDSSRRLNQLLDGLAGYARLGERALRPETTDPTRAARRAAAKLDVDGCGWPVELSIEPMPTCHADPAALEKIFEQLIANALRFARARRPAVVDVGPSWRGGAVSYTVRDNGVGFDPRYADRLYTLMGRVHGDDQLEGLGVGLATVRHLVERQGGEVWATGAVGGGATFGFTLPATGDVAAAKD